MNEDKRNKISMLSGKCLDIIHYTEKELSCVKYLFTIFGFMVLKHDYFIIILPAKYYSEFLKGESNNQKLSK